MKIYSKIIEVYHKAIFSHIINMELIVNYIN